MFRKMAVPEAAAVKPHYQTTFLYEFQLPPTSTQTDEGSQNPGKCGIKECRPCSQAACREF